jgi:hypothetical protein
MTAKYNISSDNGGSMLQKLPTRVRSTGRDVLVCDTPIVLSLALLSISGSGRPESLAHARLE